MVQQIHQVFKQIAQLDIVQQVVQNTHPHVRPVDEVPVDAWTKSLGKDEIVSSQRNSLPDDAFMMPRITCFRLMPPSQIDLLPSEHPANLWTRKLQSRNTHHVAEEFPTPIIALGGYQTYQSIVCTRSSTKRSGLLHGSDSIPFHTTAHTITPAYR